MAQIDRAAIDTRGIPSDQLMENAGQGVVRLIVENRIALSGEMVAVLCGKGNNGGDGLVIARGLYQQGITPRVFLFAQPDDLRGDAALNFNRLPEAVRQSLQVVIPGENAPPEDYLDAIQSSALIVDALFGTGFRGRLPEAWDAFLLPLRPLREKILAVDIASGVDSNTGEASPQAVQAKWTATMGLPKKGQLLREGLDCTGHLEVLDIGFPRDLTLCGEQDIALLEADDIARLLPRRLPSAHKGTAGRLLVIAGSTGLTGAATLCCEAALCAGAGLVTLGIAESLNTIVEIKITEVMTQPLPDTGDGHLSEAATEVIVEAAKRCDALAIGSGLGRHPSTLKLVCDLLQKMDVPLVLDADGIYAVASAPEVLRGKPIVLTPHPGEMAHFLGISIEEVQQKRWEISSETARRLGITVVLKGAASVIAAPDGRLRINPTGNSAMASAGMGDVLTGLVASFLTQGLKPFEAAQAAVYCHGLAADLWVAECGYHSITAGEVLDWSREAIRVVFEKPENRVRPLPVQRATR